MRRIEDYARHVERPVLREGVKHRAMQPVPHPRPRPDHEPAVRGGFLHSEARLTSTYTTAANTASSEADCFPPPCGRTETAGNSGRTVSHNPSGTIHDH
jgi:hypothetical protein